MFRLRMAASRLACGSKADDSTGLPRCSPLADRGITLDAEPLNSGGRLVSTPSLLDSNCSLRRCSSFRNRFKSFTISSLISVSTCAMPDCSARNCEAQIRFEKRFASARESRSATKCRMSPSPRSCSTPFGKQGDESSLATWNSYGQATGRTWMSLMMNCSSVVLRSIDLVSESYQRPHTPCITVVHMMLTHTSDSSPTSVLVP